MRLATIEHDGRPRVAVVEGEPGQAAAAVTVLDGIESMLDLVDAGLGAALDRVESSRGEQLPLAAVRLMAPIEPRTFRDFVAFEEHTDAMARGFNGREAAPEAWFDAPTFYFGNPRTMVGPGVGVAFPARSAAKDFEVEVAAVLGGGGTSLSLAEAADAVFGYCVLVDWSARDLQGREMQVGLGPAKGKDFACTIGPWIVTADELAGREDADGFLDLWCSVEVNGVEVGRDLLSNAGWGFADMVAYASRDSRVGPGDVLGSGTVGNGGCLAELWANEVPDTPATLAVGDVVTVTVEGIGSVSNVVATAPPPPAVRPPRRRDVVAARRARGAGARS